jgi:hypothetical protein
VTARWVVWATLAVAGCGRGVTSTAEPDGGVTNRHTVGLPASPPPPVRQVPPAAAAPPSAAEPDDPDLHVEAPEPDPRSKTVKLKLAITPPATGAVMWGRKKLADIKPGHMTVEFERRRDSGPLDVLVRADSFLLHHIRLFTDRDDRLSVRLIRPEDARGLLGYRAPATPP